MRWFSLKTLYPLRRSRVEVDDPHLEAEKLAAQRRLLQAYQTTFARSSADAQLVLEDLALYTSFYEVNGPMTPGEARAFSDGMRATFLRIFNNVNLTDEERMALATAARSGSLASIEEPVF